MKKTIALLLVLVMAVACLAGCTPKPSDQPAQNGTEDPYAKWPEQDITLDVGFSAGGTSDTCARKLGELMGAYLGVNVVVQNITGGSCSKAGMTVSNAASDGYTWLGTSVHSPGGWRVMDYADLSWENYYTFAAATAPYVLFVNKDSEYNTYEELFTAMKADKTIKWGNAGLGSINQLTGQLMCDILGLQGNSLAYNGGREAATKVMAGEVVWSWCGASDIMDLAVSGEIKVLGVCDSNDLTIKSATGEYTAPSLTKKYPELSTLEGLLYWGILINRDTPATIVSKITEAFNYAVHTDSFAKYCTDNSLALNPVTGVESDKLQSRLESIYSWGLYDVGLAAKSPETWQIQRIADLTFPSNDRQKNANPWPENK